MLQQLFLYAKQNNCSDLHLSTNSQPAVRLDGELKLAPGVQPLTAEQIYAMLSSVMNESQKKVYETQKEIDFAVQAQGNLLRYRANAFHTIKGPAAAFREIPTKIKTLDEIGAPKVISEFAHFKKGIVLVVGPTGSGKSTTLASLINHINESHPYHIITVEDPVEFVHQNNKSVINQREVGSDTLSFAAALKSALREDPNVILVGEMRDVETMRLALTAAETGHLVLATLHTNSAAQTVNRIIDVFPADDKTIIRGMLSNSIRAIISQRLIKRKGGGRCAAYEIMIANPSIRNLIREDKIPQINSIIELGKKNGTQLMKDAVADLLSKDIITKESMDEALFGE
jgi:twitching motility protein PilT